MSLRISLSAVLLLCATQAMAASARYEAAVKARIENSYAVVLFADGTKGLVPLASLQPADRAWLTELSRRSPLAPGKSQVAVVNAGAEVKVKNTILTVKTDSGEFILDNLTDEIRIWDATGYRFVKRQSQEDPNIWVTLEATPRTALN